MVKSLDEFILKVTDFQSLKNSEMIDYFSYFLVKFKALETFKPKEVSECFAELSIPPYSNISKYLSDNSIKRKGQQKFIKNNKNSTYKLSRQTLEELEKNINIDTPVAIVNNTMRSLLNQLQQPSEKEYLEEAIRTFEVKAFRASIIMVWLLTIDHLFEYILANKLTDFISALRRANINKLIHSKDDFGDIKESQFIEVCRSAGIISNDVRKILDAKLGIRNSFAHPSTITLPKSKALEFIEDLVENIILKY
jgi:hypothetical protein